jgi:hypothetical protein
LTLLKAKLRADAVKTMNDALGDDAFKGSDGVEFLQAIYRNPAFDFEIRMEAATRAAPFERAKKTESVIDDKRHYVARMPEPVKDLEEWKRLYMEEEPTPADAAAEAEWTEKLKTFAAGAAAKKNGGSIQ